MAQSDPGQEWASWRVEDPTFTIESLRSALETVRGTAMEGLHRLAKGGLEVGGLLIGERSGDAVRILDSQPIACEHALGPSFTLSPQDEEALGRQIASLAPAPGVAGPVVVGWYHSHTRSRICLTEKDLEIHDRYFPEPWQVALVVLPDKLRPARAGFFFREPDGKLRRESSYGEFELLPVPKMAKPAAVQPEAQAVPLAVAVAEPEPPPPVAPRRPSPGFWLLFALAWCISAGSLAFALRDYWLPPPAAPVVVVEPVEPRPDPAVLELTRERDELAAEVEKLRAEVDRLTKAIPAPRRAKTAPRNGAK